MQKLAFIVLLVNGISFIGTGAYAFVAPAQLAGMAEYSFNSSAAVAEFWANYGGLYLLYGLFLCWSAFSTGRRSGALTVLLFTSVGLAIGRLLGMLLVAYPGAVQLGFLGWELISAVLCFFCLRRLRVV